MLNIVDLNAILSSKSTHVLTTLLQCLIARLRLYITQHDVNVSRSARELLILPKTIDPLYTIEQLHDLSHGHVIVPYRLR